MISGEESAALERRPPTADLELRSGGGLAAAADRQPALPQRLDSLDTLVPGYLVRFRPATRAPTAPTSPAGSRSATRPAPTR